MNDPKDTLDQSPQSDAEPPSMQEYIGAGASTPPQLPKESRRPRYLPPTPGDKKKAKPSFNQTTPLDDSVYVRTPLFALSGRMGRLSSLAATLLVILLTSLGLFAIVTLMTLFAVGPMAHGVSGPLGFGMGMLTLVFVTAIAVVFVVIVIDIKRLHDLNLSGWWVTLPVGVALIGVAFEAIGINFVSMIASPISLIFSLGLLLIPGTAGENQYGPPRFTSTGEKICGWIYVALMAIFVVLAIQAGESIKSLYAPPPTTMSAADQAKLDAQMADVEKSMAALKAQMAKDSAAAQAPNDQSTAQPEAPASTAKP